MRLKSMPPTRQQFTSTPTEADACRKYVVPKLQAAGWNIGIHEAKVLMSEEDHEGISFVTGLVATAIDCKRQM